MPPSRTRRVAGAAMLLLAGVLPRPAAAQDAYTLRGTVVDAGTQRPLADVSVTLRGTQARTVTVQGGAYAEHRIDSVVLDGRETPVGGRDFTIQLEPGCGARLRLAMRRYANRPTLAFPWDR